MSFLSIIRRPKVKVLDLEPRPEYQGDGAIKGQQVALWRPPVMLDHAGNTMPGVSKDLIANYLASTVSAMAKADLGPVTVTWKEQESRFATTTFTIHAWGQAVDVLHPIATISQELANALEHYRGGLASKVKELHKGHQTFEEANASIRQAIRRVERLRDDNRPHFNDAEFLFIQANMQQALTLSALIPVSDHAPEDVFKEAVTV